MSTILAPRQTKEHLDKFIIGQDEAKIAVSNAIFIHTSRMIAEFNPEFDCDVNTMPKSNLMMLGPSGSGKTYMVKKAAKASGLPIYATSALNIAPPGWIGVSFDKHLKNLMLDIGGNPNYPTVEAKESVLKYALFFIDEIDKICIRACGSGGGDHNQLIQHSILTSVEGATSRIKCKFDLNCPSGTRLDQSTVVDTSTMMFVFAGHFESLHKERANVKSTIGFVNSKPTAPSMHQEVAKSGMIPELLGRISLFTETNKLTKKDYKKILFEAAESPLLKYENLFKQYHEKFELSKRELKTIIDYCIEQPTGARTLNYILSEVLKQRIFKLGG